jgi:hypothetical protein
MAVMNNFNWSEPVDFTNKSMDEFKEWAGDRWIKRVSWKEYSHSICKFNAASKSKSRFNCINKNGFVDWWGYRDSWQRDESIEGCIVMAIELERESK